MKTLAERTEHAISEGFTVGQLAKAAGKTSAAVSQWRSGGTLSLKADSAAGLEKLTGWSSAWWATGKGERGKTKPQASGTPEDGENSVAHRLSDPPFDDRPITGEKIMELERDGALPLKFVYVLADDAMGPDYRAGTEVLFERVADADALKVGAGLLLKDGNSELHVRRKAQGDEPGQWIAKATNPNRLYRDFDNRAAGLVVIGWWRGVINKGLEE